jgi:hypothetical protein
VTQLAFNHDELFIKPSNKRPFESFTKNNRLDDLEHLICFDEQKSSEKVPDFFNDFQPLSDIEDMHQDLPGYDQLQTLGPDFDQVPVYEPKLKQLEKMEEFFDFELWEDPTIPLQSDILFDFKPLSVLRKSSSFVQNDKAIEQLLLNEGFDSVTQFQIAGK